MMPVGAWQHRSTYSHLVAEVDGVREPMQRLRSSLSSCQSGPRLLQALERVHDAALQGELAAAVAALLSEYSAEGRKGGCDAVLAHHQAVRLSLRIGECRLQALLCRRLPELRAPTLAQRWPLWRQ